MNLGTVRGTITLDISGAISNIRQVQTSLSGFRGQVDGMASNLRSVGTAMTAGITAPAGVAAAGLGAFIGDSISKAADLEQQMAGVAAVMGKNVNEIQPLRALVDQLAVNPNLKVSAVEAAAAVEMLGRNGVDMQGIMDGMAESTVALSNATGTDMAKSADIMTDAMVLFEDSISSSREAINGMTGLTVNSKFTMNDYSYALANAGGVAKSMGVNFSDFNTTIAGISSYFSSGMEAGTSYKTFLSRLVPATEKAEDVMLQLGLMTAEGGNAFFDASGQIKSMSEISGLLQNSLKGLSTEQRQAALHTLFGADAIRAAVAISDLGAEGFTNLANTMEATGDAQLAAATRVDTFQGAMEILKSVLESVQIQIGDAFLPIVTQLATSLTNFVSENGASTIELFRMLATQIAALIPIAASFLTNVLSIAKSIAEQFSPKLLLAGAAITAIAAAIGPVMVAIGLMIPAITAAGAGLLAVIGAAFTPFGAAVGALAVGAIALGVAVMTNFLGIRDGLIAFWDEVKPLLLEFGQTMGGHLTEAFSILKTIAGDVMTALSNWWAENKERVLPIIESIKTGLLTGLAAALETIASITETVLAAVAAFWAEYGDEVIAVITTILDKILAFIELVNEGWSDHGETIKGTISQLWQTVQTTIQTAITGLQAIIQAFLQAVDQWWQQNGQAVQIIIQATWQVIQTIVQTAAATIQAAIQTALQVIQQLWQTNANSVRSIVQGYFAGIQAVIQGAVSVITSLIQMLAAAITGDWQRFGQELQNIWRTIWQTIQSIIQSQIQTLAEVFRVIANTAADALGGFDWSGISQSIIDGLANGIRGGASLVADAARDAASSAYEAAKSYLGISSPSKMFSQLGEFSGEGMAEGLSRSAGLAASAAASMGQKMVGATMPVATGNASADSAAVLPPITINIYAKGGEPQAVGQAAQQGVLQAARSMGLN